MRVVLAALAGAVCALPPGAALAQTPADEAEIVVTAPLEGARIESLQGAAVLGREDIIENLTGGLGDTLASLPGVSTSFYGAGASRPIIRGLGEDRVRVLQNGVGAIDASSASPDHAVTADGLDAERIEVLRGAAALAYGGNAIGGVINVVDQSIPTRLPENMFGLAAMAALSAADNGRQGAARGVFDAGAVVVQVSAAARETEDYSIPGFARSETARLADPLPPGGEPEGEAPNSWTGYRAHAAGASVIRNWGFAGLAVKRTETEYGLPPETASEPGGRIELAQTRVEARGDFRLDWGPFNRFDFAVQHGDYEHAEIEGSGAVGTVFTNQGYEGRFEAHHRGGRLEGALGVQIIATDFAATGDEAFITPTSTRDFGAFVVERWDFGAWGLEGGARLENREIDNVGGGARAIDTASVSGGVFIRPAEHWFVGATLARTERAPTGIELFADGPHLATGGFEAGNPALNAEIAASFEISARYGADAVSFEVNIFRIGFDDFIALVERGDVWWRDEPTGASGFAPNQSDPGIPVGASILPVFQFVQQDTAFEGGELIARARLFDVGGVRIEADGQVEIVRAGFDAGGRPPRIPPRSFTLGVEAETAILSGRIEWVNVATQNRVSGFETPTEGYDMVNARLSWRPFGDRLTLLLDARNLAAAEGRVHASFLKHALPLPGRGVRLALTSSF